MADFFKGAGGCKGVPGKDIAAKSRQGLFIVRQEAGLGIGKVRSRKLRGAGNSPSNYKQSIKSE